MAPSTGSGLLTVFMVLLFAGLLPVAGGADALPPIVDFNRDIRPIFSDTCFQCHGPDKAKRKAKLRLDTEEGAFADLGDRFALLAGSPAKSELYLRITSADDKQRMPPAKTGHKLTQRQINLIRRWIEQGAKWQKHWSFLPPRRSELPRVKNTQWCRNGIDYFILDRLEAEGLTPSPEADKATQIRRVTLDLTGLPPTPTEVDAFLADSSPLAYEKVVDRLLASPRYGERMAMPWINAARYADTHGYQTDGERHMWRWRDWVIDALNQNMPFDLFTIEQLAGDMLPNPTLDQRIATGFNRNHRGNSEGGIIPEEYAVEYVVDRVETTATVWLGVTMGCGRCHDHKYDPFTQKDFYRLFSYFNNVPEKGRAIKYGNSPPFIKAPTRNHQDKLALLDQQLGSAEHALTGLEGDVAYSQMEWEKSLNPGTPLQWSIDHHLLAHYPLDGTASPLVAIQAPKKEDGPAATKDKKDLKAEISSPPLTTFVAGPLGQAADFDGQRWIDAGDLADIGFYDKFTFAAWIFPQWHKGGTILSRMTDAVQGDGYSLCLEKGKIQLNLSKRWLDDALRVETTETLLPGRWYHVATTYDGSRVASGVKIYVDGKPVALKVLLDDLNQPFGVKQPLRIGGGGGPEGRFHGAIDDVRIYTAVLSPDEAIILATPDAITAIAAKPAKKRTREQALKIRQFFLQKHAPATIQEARQRMLALQKKKEELVEGFPTVMVMEEMPTPRETHILVRGAYDRPGETVAPDVPGCLPPLPKELPNNRLGLARWLVSPGNPLTARVTANRFWLQYFGAGLVQTVDDFGFQGEWPSHPELLDWLAVEFMNPSPSNKWDIKALQRLIVTSATYRQSTKTSLTLLQKDPGNRLLARGPRLRLSAEMVRDQALAASGLLAERLGGPSVKPYQPAGLWKELTGTEDYQQDHGENLYRRGLYTFWKRTVAPPQMVTFDAAGRETCYVRETRTNTPLQALTLMNDVTYAETSRVLAQRVMLEGGPTPQERIALAFRLVLTRQPRPAELAILVQGYQEHLEEFRKDPKAAQQLISAGEFPRNDKLDASEMAAYAAVAGLILNLDEAVNKE